MEQTELSVVGAWQPCSAGAAACSEISTSANFTYSTADNSKPRLAKVPEVVPHARRAVAVRPPRRVRLSSADGRVDLAPPRAPSRDSRGVASADASLNAMRPVTPSKLTLVTSAS